MSTKPHILVCKAYKSSKSYYIWNIGDKLYVTLADSEIIILFSFHFFNFEFGKSKVRPSSLHVTPAGPIKPSDFLSLSTNSLPLPRFSCFFSPVVHSKAAAVANLSLTSLSSNAWKHLSEHSLSFSLRNFLF